MIVVAIICTLIAGFVSSFLEPLPFAMTLPIVVMGSFILKAIQDKKN
ncbi:hypothetical protein SAMN05446037_101888 [Anaerovirgula multivorans]|uniref:Uncharacterized protein n=1 Tax=Anaerovirgula multivorans TaxID=312168 RepID=A0A239GTP8_9FIRM|nr:hypothetical protein [Anaerovirgula multivorans]SNS72589.1 hypothetical protein SAMN05446037_101888 [Anaerovirgula multivorans]